MTRARAPRHEVCSSEAVHPGRLLRALVATLLLACTPASKDAGPPATSSGPQPGPGESAPSAAAGASSAALRGPTVDSPRKPDIDALFEAWRRELPKAESLSDANGASLRCGDRGATYNRLRRGAEQVPLDGDADLVALVPWARDPDECLRDIAIHAILRRVPFDSNRLVVPSMDDVEHHLYHLILVSLIAYLDEHHVAYDAGAFDGLGLDVTAKDYEAKLVGEWEEQETEHKNFRLHVSVTKDEVRVTRARTAPDPAWPDHTDAFHVTGVTVDRQRALVVESDSSVESNANGYRGERQATPTTLRFWPTGDQVGWLDRGRGGGWVKVRRAAH